MLTSNIHFFKRNFPDLKQNFGAHRGASYIWGRSPLVSLVLAIHGWNHRIRPSRQIISHSFVFDIDAFAKTLLSF